VRLVRNLPPPKAVEVHDNAAITFIAKLLGQNYHFIVLMALFFVLIGLLTIKKKFGRILFTAGLVIIISFLVWLILFTIENSGAGRL